MPNCKGHKRDGTPCRSTILLDNGYCRAHQDQALEAKALEETSQWTRERLEEVITAHGGPEGLDLAGADLSNLRLIGMDLHRIILGRTGAIGQQVLTEVGFASGSRIKLVMSPSSASGRDKESETWIVTDLRGAKLWGTHLQEANLAGADLRGAEMLGTHLEGASLYGANLRGADLRGASLQGASLYGVDLQRADLRGTNLQGASLRSADLREVDLLDVKTGGLLRVRLHRAKLDHTALKREQLGPAIGDEQAGEWREARDAYLALKQNFEDLGDYEAASWAYIKERQMEKACSRPWRARRFYGEEYLGDTREHKLSTCHPRVWWFYMRHTAKWLGDWLVELVCGYGERTWRTVATMGVVFAVFVGIYWLTWAVMKVEHTPRTTVLVPTRNLIDLAIFGLGSFTTMDPKGLEPRAAWVQFVAGFEALLGISLTGLLGFVLGNRIRRS